MADDVLPTPAPEAPGPLAAPPPKPRYGLGASLFALYAWGVWLTLFVAFAPCLLLLLWASKQATIPAMRAFLRVVFGLTGVKVKLVGAEAVDWNTPQVFVGNHQSMLDHFAFFFAIQRHMVGVEKQENHKLPVYGLLARRWGNLPINRSDPAQAIATIHRAAETIKAGTSILIFPEGTRTKDGEVGPFKKGSFHLAREAGAHILPVAIAGAYEVVSSRGWRIQPGTITLAFGAPIDPQAYPGEDVLPLLEAVRAEVLRLYEANRPRA